MNLVEYSEQDLGPFSVSIKWQVTISEGDVRSVVARCIVDRKTCSSKKDLTLDDVPSDVLERMEETLDETKNALDR